MSAMISKDQEKGFTLIEMAMVLVLVAMFVAGLTISLATYTQAKKVELTRAKADRILDALSLFVQRNYRLPCPADPAGDALDTVGAEGQGACLKSGGGLSGTLSLYQTIQGIVPYRDLGLSEEDVKDGWGRYFTYRPAPNLTVAMSDDAQQVGKACLTAAWFVDTNPDPAAKTLVHYNRAKAAYCCNAEPDATIYLGGVPMPAGWRNVTIGAAQDKLKESGIVPGQVDEDASLSYTGKWYPTAAADFARFDAGPQIPTKPLGDYFGVAVTLISHGANGLYSYVRGAPANERLGGKITGVTLEGDGADSLSPLEAMVIAHPEIVSGATYNSVLSPAYFDPLGLRYQVSDDITVYARNDELMARLGHASCTPAPSSIYERP